MKKDKKAIHYRGRKLHYSGKKIIVNKTSIIYFLLGLCDVVLVIYCARYNKAHYVKLLDEDIFIGKTKNLIFGRNYINLIISLFFYVYSLLIYRLFLKKRFNKMYVIGSLLLIFIVNIILFVCFSVKVY